MQTYTCFLKNNFSKPPTADHVWHAPGLKGSETRYMNDGSYYNIAMQYIGMLPSV